MVDVLGGQNGALRKILKNWVKELILWVVLKFFLSITKKLVKLSDVTVRISSGLFALLLCVF